MTEHVLDYDHSVTPQEFSYDCGPASAQVVLNGKGVIASESDLINKMGTNEDGTGYVGLVERALNGYLPDAKYTSIYITNDPPTQDQTDTLWANIVRSINAGYGVVMNWDAPPSNYPIGVKGSASPAYGGGEVFHYVACMGYDDDPALRALWIADSGFRPFGYWMSLDQAASLIPPKGYAYSTVSVPAPAPVPPPPPPPALPAPDPATAQLLSRVMGGRLDVARYLALLPAVAASLRACSCTSVPRIAMWVAQIGHESGGLYYTEEIADGSAYEGRADLGNTEPGDGVRFKGRSWIQITGRANYAQLSQWAYAKDLVPSVTYFVDNPTELASDQYAGLGAAWYWVVARPGINALTDARDVPGVTQQINGGQNGIDDRQSRYDRAISVGGPLLALATPTALPADPTQPEPEETGGDDLMTALTADEQRELLDNTRWLREQLGPNIWGPSSSLGTDSAGAELTLRDGLAALKRSVQVGGISTLPQSQLSEVARQEISAIAKSILADLASLDTTPTPKADSA